jgi:hypothetical protein
MNKSNGYNIIKKDHTTYDSQSHVNSDSDSDSDSYDSNDSTNQLGGEKNLFKSISDSNYKKPKGGTYQDNLSKSEIKKKLIGFKSLKTKEAKKYLLTLTPFKTWIKHYNPTTRQFRTGGLLLKVDPKLRFIMLVNTANKISWSVQLDDNIIFVPDPLKKEQEEKDKKDREINIKKEEIIKDKLYKLFITGKLKKIP